MRSLGLLQIVCSGVIAILIANTPALAESSCAGVPSAPTSNDLCSQQTSEKACLSKFAIETEFISDTCRWITTTGAVTTEIQDTYTLSGATWIANLAWPAGVSGFSLKVTLPPSAKSKWSGYLSLQSGPQDVSTASKYMDPKRAFTFSGCQTGTTCELTQTIPKNVSPSTAFTKSSLLFTALSTDPVLINQFNTNGYMDDTYPFKLKFQTKTTLAAGNPPATPAISDIVQFGPTDYVMDKISSSSANSHYSLITYKSYEISKVTAANWKVNVGASIPRSAKKTSMTSMLLTEKAYNDYFAKCKTTCSPPTRLAVKGTLCTGLACAKSAKGLSTSQKYILVVSYPTISSLTSSKSYGTSALKSSFTKQLVKTEVFASGWKLSKKKSARMALSGGDGDTPFNGVNLGMALTRLN